MKRMLLSFVEFFYHFINYEINILCLYAHWFSQMADLYRVETTPLNKNGKPCFYL